MLSVLTSKALIDSSISHDKFVSVNNVLREYKKIKKEIKNSRNFYIYLVYLSHKYGWKKWSRNNR